MNRFFCFVLLSVVSIVSASQSQGFPQSNGVFYNPFMNPFYFNMMAPNPYYASMFGPLSQQAQKIHSPHAGRPSAPDVSTPATTTTTASTIQDNHGADLQMNAQTSSSLASSLSLNTLVGSLSSVGSGAMGSAHTLFVPPYSWMWRVAMSLGSLKSDSVNKVADVPELLSLITGYYAGSPDAMKAVKMAEAGEDKFSLSSLSQLFGSPEVAVKKQQPIAKVQPKAKPVQTKHYAPKQKANKFPKFDESDESDSSSSSPFDMMSLFGGGSPKAPTHSKGMFEDVGEDDDVKDDESLFASMMNASNKKSKSKSSKSSSSAMDPLSMISSLMNASGKSSGGGSPTEQMIKMAAPLLGVDPALASMAAPLIGNMF
eukprot:c17030_g1_i1.p1 GENE.c17030_g1_i1~~c17030_g1_i1.p1  ORF type:complete len:378 (+),score=195.84 c17030_g1_i1:24-1136(+)